MLPFTHEGATAGEGMRHLSRATHMGPALTPVCVEPALTLGWSSMHVQEPESICWAWVIDYKDGEMNTDKMRTHFWGCAGVRQFMLV